MTWDCNFGDGSPHFTGQNPPAHVYPAGPAKKYGITLTVTNSGCTDVRTDTVIANEVSTLSISAPTACKYSTVTIISKHPSNTVSYIYHYGDGTSASSTDGNGSHIYTAAGPYQVTLETTDATGCTLTSAPITVTITGPTAAFTTPKTTGCDSLKAGFTDKSTTSGAAIKKWAWAFGDGGTAAVQNPTYTYHAQ